MTNPNSLTAAEQIHRGAFAAMHVEETVDQIWPNLVGHISTDHYDNSLELYFLEEAPRTMSCTIQEARVLFELGFHRLYLNFCDGTEQYCHEGGIQVRKKVENPRGGSKSTLRPRLQIRISELEHDVEEMRAIMSLVGAALNGTINPADPYPGKPIALVERALAVARPE